MIRSNAHKYSISAMCIVLKISRSTYYYESKSLEKTDKISSLVIKIFKKSRNNYGTRKIRVELQKLEHQVSRRRIGQIMKVNCLVSNYTKAQFKVRNKTCNNAEIENKISREFSNNEPFEVITSDLTYVRVGNNWNYICFLIDLFNREIIGYSVGKKKDAELVKNSFVKISENLSKIKVFHTDRGSEFKNKLLDKMLSAFNIERSLSAKGCPYDNAVSESTFHVLKVEFINNHIFSDIIELKLYLADYINWYNNIRIHGSLNYLTPIEYRVRYG